MSASLLPAAAPETHGRTGRSSKNPTLNNSKPFCTIINARINLFVRLLSNGFDDCPIVVYQQKMDLSGDGNPASREVTNEKKL